MDSPEKRTNCSADGTGNARRATSDPVWGPVATQVPDPQSCIAHCRQRFLDAVAPFYSERTAEDKSRTLPLLCDQLSSSSGSGLAASSGATTVRKRGPGKKRRRRAEVQGVGTGSAEPVRALDPRADEDGIGTPTTKEGAAAARSAARDHGDEGGWPAGLGQDDGGEVDHDHNHDRDHDEHHETIKQRNDPEIRLAQRAQGDPRLWQLYCCDHALCGVDPDTLGQDPNVDRIINECHAIDRYSVYDPGRPEYCKAEWLLLAPNSTDSSSSSPPTASMAPASEGQAPNGVNDTGPDSATTTSTKTTAMDGGCGTAEAAAVTTMSIPEPSAQIEGLPDGTNTSGGAMNPESFGPVSVDTVGSFAPLPTLLTTAAATQHSSPASAASPAAAASSPSPSSQQSVISIEGIPVETTAVASLVLSTRSSASHQPSPLPVGPAPSQTDADSVHPALTSTSHFALSTTMAPTPVPIPIPSNGDLTSLNYSPDTTIPAPSSLGSDPASPNSPPGSNLSQGARAGLIIGLIAMAAILSGLTFGFLRRRRRRARGERLTADEEPSTTTTTAPPSLSTRHFRFAPLWSRRKHKQQQHPSSIRELIRHPNTESPTAMSPAPLISPMSASGNSAFGAVPGHGGSSFHFHRDTGASFDVAEMGSAAAVADAAARGSGGGGGGTWSSRRRSSTSHGAPLTPPLRLSERRMLSLSLSPQSTRETRDSHDQAMSLSMSPSEHDLRAARPSDMITFDGPLGSPVPIPAPLSPKSQFLSSPICSPTQAKLHPRHERAPSGRIYPSGATVTSSPSGSSILSLGQTSPIAFSDYAFPFPPRSVAAAPMPVQTPPPPPLPLPSRASPPPRSPMRPVRPHDIPLEIPDLVTQSPHRMSPGPPPTRDLPAIPPPTARSATSMSASLASPTSLRFHELSPARRAPRVTAQGGTQQQLPTASLASEAQEAASAPGLAITTGIMDGSADESKERNKSPARPTLSEADLEHLAGRS